jgi:hypothetical protein
MFIAQAEQLRPIVIGIGAVDAAEPHTQDVPVPHASLEIFTPPPDLCSTADGGCLTDLAGVCRDA